MKTLYLDLFSGVSGDMFIAALIDVGVDAAMLERELKKLKLGGHHVHVSRRQTAGIDGVKFDVHLAEDHKHDHDHAAAHHSHTHNGHHRHRHIHNRTFAEIKAIIERSGLSKWVKRRATSVFQRIAVAEGKIHGVPPGKVHFHEVGAVDSIVDIVGACVGLELLGKPRVIAGTVIEGVGWVDCQHGRFPVPAPATLAILGARGIGVTQCDEPHELVTPTGAALIAEFAEEFGPMQGLVPEKIGYGLGSRQNKTRPNALRAVLGVESKVEGLKSKAAPKSEVQSPKSPRTASRRLTQELDWETDTVAVLETNLDDVNPEILGSFVEKALAGGALDVFHTPIQMKKNRPGVLLTVLCAEADADNFAAMMLRETTAFGIRRHTAERRKLRREFTSVKTRFGAISVKIGKLGGQTVQASPEFESCRKAAARARVPLKTVYEAAIRATRNRGR